MNGNSFNLNSYSGFGYNTHSSQTFYDVNFNGYLKLNNSHVTNKTNVNGQLEAIQTNLNQLFVQGSVNLVSCHIFGLVFVKGAFVAERTIFYKPIQISTKHLSLIESKTKDIIVGALLNNEEQIVKLERNSQVSGFIRFEGGNGKVYLEQNCEITGGIEGGKIM